MNTTLFRLSFIVLFVDVVFVPKIYAADRFDYVMWTFNAAAAVALTASIALWVKERQERKKHSTEYQTSLIKYQTLLSKTQALRDENRQLAEKIEQRKRNIIGWRMNVNV